MPPAARQPCLPVRQSGNDHLPRPRYRHCLSESQSAPAPARSAGIKEYPAADYPRKSRKECSHRSSFHPQTDTGHTSPDLWQAPAPGIPPAQSAHPEFPSVPALLPDARRPARPCPGQNPPPHKTDSMEFPVLSAVSGLFPPQNFSPVPVPSDSEPVPAHPALLPGPDRLPSASVSQPAAFHGSGLPVHTLPGAPLPGFHYNQNPRQTDAPPGSVTEGLRLSGKAPHCPGSSCNTAPSVHFSSAPEAALPESVPAQPGPVPPACGPPPRAAGHNVPGTVFLPVGFRFLLLLFSGTPPAVSGDRQNHTPAPDSPAGPGP